MRAIDEQGTATTCAAVPAPSTGKPAPAGTATAATTARLDKEQLRELLRGRWHEVYKALAIFRSLSSYDSNGWVSCSSPLRTDDSPSFSINKEHGGFKDHGTDESGDAFKFVMEALKVDFTTALRRLNDVAAQLGATRGLTVSQYARARKFDEAWLRREFGLRDETHQGEPCVVMPYLDGAGNEIAVRRRLSMSGRDRFRWKQGARAAELVYGVDKAAGFTGDLVFLAEGESNLHAAHRHQLQCLTIPGKANGHAAVADAIVKCTAVRRAVVLLDPDAQELAQSLARELQVRGWKGELMSVVVQDMCGHKDLCDLHVNEDDTRFRELVQRLIQAAALVPIDNIGEQRRARPLSPDEKPTDCGNAIRFVRQHGGDLRYVRDRKAWYVWNGKRWTADRGGIVERKAKATARSIFAEAEQLESDEARREHVKWALASENLYRINAMIDLARSECGIPVDLGELDADPYVLNVNNGTIDLRTGALRPHGREDLITRMCAVDYDPDAKCPTWDRLLELVTGANANLIRYLQKAVGYTLTGDTSEECLFFLFGGGKNGKSTFTGTIAAMLGDYHATTSPEALMVKYGSNGSSHDLARLDGPRLVLASETDEGKRLSESLVKQMTGNDTLQARFLYQEHFQFKPRFKIWIHGNHRPTIRGTDDGIWRRIRLIPFTQVIPDSERKDRTELDRLLRTEWPGILAWAVRGCLLWQKERLGVPQEVLDATGDYRSENDVMQHFIETGCEIDQYARTKSTEMYEHFKRWAEQSGEHYVWKHVEFNKHLKTKGYEHRKSTKGVFYWFGIKVRHEGYDAVGADFSDEPANPRGTE